MKDDCNQASKVHVNALSDTKIMKASYVNKRKWLQCLATSHLTITIYHHVIVS